MLTSRRIPILLHLKLWIQILTNNILFVRCVKNLGGRLFDIAWSLILYFIFHGWRLLMRSKSLFFLFWSYLKLDVLFIYHFKILYIHQILIRINYNLVFLQLIIDVILIKLIHGCVLFLDILNFINHWILAVIVPLSLNVFCTNLVK